jgi:hypothetical protein
VIQISGKLRDENNWRLERRGDDPSELNGSALTLKEGTGHG